jgi:uncharacterized protein YbcI
MDDTAQSPQDPPHPSRGDTLERLSSEMVRLQKKFWGRGPDSAKSYLVDDLLFIVMRGGMTVAERSMLEGGHQDSVRRTRQEFEDDMAGRLRSMVEEVTGREVVTYQSQILFEPELVIETFVFAQPASAGEVAATAQGQLDDVVVGEVDGDGA